MPRRRLKRNHLKCNTVRTQPPIQAVIRLPPKQYLVTALNSLVSTLRTVVDIAMQKQLTFLAASVAYYAFVSLLPALLLLLVVSTTLGGVALGEALVARTGDFLTPVGQSAIMGTIENAPSAGGVTLLSLAFLSWGTLKVFRALDMAFLMVYDQTDTSSIRRQFTDAIVVLFGVGGGIVLMIGMGAVLAFLPLGPAGWLVGLLGLPAILTTVLLPLYHRFPNPPISFRAALPGAVVAAIGWTVLQAGFQLYAAYAVSNQLYGIVGGLLLLATWLYIAAILIILGAILNRVLADSDVSIDRQLQHAG